MTGRIVHWLAALSLIVSGAHAHAQETVTYTYDALGRLIASSTAGGPNSGVSTSTTFDPAGNRTNYATVKPSPGGNCTFSAPDEAFYYDYEFPLTQKWMWVNISGTCTAPTVFSYSFPAPGPSGTFTIQPGATGYYYYELPEPCAYYYGLSSVTSTISIVSGPGTITDGSANLQLYCW